MGAITYYLKGNKNETYTVAEWLTKNGIACARSEAKGVSNTLGGYSLISDIVFI